MFIIAHNNLGNLLRHIKLILTANTVQNVLKHHRQQRHKNDYENNHRQIVMNERHATQRRAHHRQASAPQQCAQQIPHRELHVVITRDARRNRHERAHKRHKPADHQRTATIARKKVLRLRQILGFQNPCIILKQTSTPVVANVITHLRTRHRAHRNREHQNEQGQPQLRMQQTRSEHQRIARQNREQHARLDKHNQCDARQNPRPHRYQQRLRILKPLDHRLQPRRRARHHL